MKSEKKSFFIARASFVGTVIGAGIFGVPYVVAQVGMAVGALLFAVLTAVILLLHLMYAEVIDRTKEKHRLIGYTQHYFGKKAKDFISFTVIIGVYGGMVAYILLANSFLSTLFGSVAGVPFFWGIIFWGFMSIAIVFGLKAVARIEVVMFFLLIAALGIIVAASSSAIMPANYFHVNLKHILLPYGVILFSLSGLGAIPEIRTFITRNDHSFRNSVISGTIFSAVVTFIFAVTVVGVSGLSTSRDAISGLVSHLGPWIAYVGALFGLLAISTSYLINGINIKESYGFDWKISGGISDIITVATPIVLVLLGVNSFIALIGILGAGFGAVNGTMVALLFLKAKLDGDRKPSFNLRVARPVVALLIFILISGGVYEIIRATLLR